MAKLTLVFLLVLGSLNQAQAMGYGVSIIELASGKKANVLRMSGEVVVMEWRGFTLAVSSLDPKLDTVVVVTSPGGNASHGLFLLGKIDDFQTDWKKNGRKVVVLAEKDCSSMCVPIYYAFENRLALTGTRFGLHAVHTEMGADPGFTHAYIKSLSDRAQARGDRDMLGWLDRKISDGAFSTPKLDATPADQLARERSGIVGPDAIVMTENAGFERALRK